MDKFHHIFNSKNKFSIMLQNVEDKQDSDELTTETHESCTKKNS